MIDFCVLGSVEMASRMLQGRLVLSRIGFPARGFVQKSVCRAVSLADKKCVACEDAAGTLEICMAMDKAKATQMLEQVIYMLRY